MKTAQNYLDAAITAVERVDTEIGIKKHSNGGCVFVDVRDSAAIEETGTIKGAHRVPRGVIEFSADEATPYHNEALKKDAEIYLVCGAGGQAALAGKTLQDMGFKNVKNVGGFSDWKDAGGPTENV